MIHNYTGNDDDDYLSTLTLDLIDQMEEHLHDMDLIFPNDNESDYVQFFIKILNDYIKLNNNTTREDVKYIQLLNYMELCFHLLIKDSLAIQ